MDLGVDGRTEPGNRYEAGQVEELAGGNERQHRRGEWRHGGGSRASEKEEQVPPEEKRLSQIFRIPRPAAGAVIAGSSGGGTGGGRRGGLGAISSGVSPGIH